MGNVVSINNKASKESRDSLDNSVLFEYQGVKFTKLDALKYGLATAVVGALAIGGALFVSSSQNRNAPSVDESRSTTPTTQPAGYNPDQENPSGIPTSGEEGIGITETQNGTTTDTTEVPGPYEPGYNPSGIPTSGNEGQ